MCFTKGSSNYEKSWESKVGAVRECMMLADSTRKWGQNFYGEIFGKKNPIRNVTFPHRYYKLISSLYVQFNQFS